MYKPNTQKSKAPNIKTSLAANRSRFEFLGSNYLKLRLGRVSILCYTKLPFRSLCVYRAILIVLLARYQYSHAKSNDWMQKIWRNDFF